MTDGFDTQTDFRNPVVEALGLDQTTVKAGDHFFLSYDVSDFTHKRNTDGKLLFGDPDPSLRDANGNYTGTEYIGTPALDANENQIYGDQEPLFWLTDADGVILERDGSPIQGFAIITNEEDTGINQVYGRFKDADGNRISGSWDSTNDGLLRFSVDDNQPNGIYTLDEFRANDNAYQSNDITLYANDSSVRFDDNFNSTSRSDGSHNIDFTQITIEVVSGTDDSDDRQIDFTVPELNNVSFKSSSQPIKTLGTPSDDIIYGSLFDDILEGLAGNDTLTGGMGADIFEFAGNFGEDTIIDFELGVDKISIKDGTGGKFTSAEYSKLGFSSLEGGGIKISHTELYGSITLEDLTVGPSLDYFDIA